MLDLHNDTQIDIDDTELTQEYTLTELFKIDDTRGLILAKFSNKELLDLAGTCTQILNYVLIHHCTNLRNNEDGDNISKFFKNLEVDEGGSTTYKLPLHLAFSNEPGKQEFKSKIKLTRHLMEQQNISLADLEKSITKINNIHCGISCGLVAIGIVLIVAAASNQANDWPLAVRIIVGIIGGLLFLAGIAFFGCGKKLIAADSINEKLNSVKDKVTPLLETKGVGFYRFSPVAVEDVTNNEKPENLSTFSNS